jgi:hypothetical protein
MTAPDDGKDPEFAAMRAVYDALSPLDGDAQSRVISYIMDRLEIETGTSAGHRRFAADEGEDEPELEQEQADAPKYGAFAELFNAAQPKTQSEKALVAGYWLQVCQGAESFDGFSANKELKHLGEGVENITAAITALKGLKPAQAMQLKKSGKSKQARKTYKLTVAGIQAVEGLING